MYKYIYTYTYIYTYMLYIHICPENNISSRLSPQYFCGNSYTWAHDVRLHTAGTNEPMAFCSLLSWLSTIWFIGTSNV